ncbi:unnamed protein product, partial [Mycena citricolor]
GILFSAVSANYLDKRLMTRRFSKRCSVPDARPTLCRILTKSNYRRVISQSPLSRQHRSGMSDPLLRLRERCLLQLESSPAQSSTGPRSCGR